MNFFKFLPLEETLDIAILGVFHSEKIILTDVAPFGHQRAKM